MTDLQMLALVIVLAGIIVALSSIAAALYSIARAIRERRPGPDHH